MNKWFLFFSSCGNVYSSLGIHHWHHGHWWPLLHGATYALLVYGPGPAMGWHFREPFFLCTHVSLCTLAAHRKKRNVCSLPRNAYSPHCSLSHPIDQVSMVFLVLQSVTTTISVFKVCVCLLAAVGVHIVRYLVRHVSMMRARSRRIVRLLLHPCVVCCAHVDEKYPLVCRGCNKPSQHTEPRRSVLFLQLDILVTGIITCIIE